MLSTHTKKMHRLIKLIKLIGGLIRDDTRYGTSQRRRLLTTDSNWKALKGAILRDSN